MNLHTYSIPEELVNRLLAHIGDHPQPMQLHADLLAYKTLQDATAKQDHADTLYVIAYDAEDKRVAIHVRSSHAPQEDEAVMTQFLELEQATRLRGVVIPPHKVGALWVMSTLHTPYAQWDVVALAVAQRFTLDTEPQRRASLQSAVVDAIRMCQP